MAINSKRKIRRRSSNNFFLPFTIILLVIISISVIIAFAWQKYQDINNPPDQIFRPSQSSSEVSTSSSTPESSKPASSDEITSSPSTVFGVPIPESARVRSEFFNDAVFIGDSITTGIELYSILPDTTVLASTGINLDNIITKKAITRGEEKVTVLDALSKESPKKIYIMLGTNGLSDLSVEQTVDLYRTFAKKVQQAKPDANIYIQSILPINEAKFAVKYSPNLKNAKIDECNKALMQMSGEEKMFYVDVNSAIRDESGGLPSDFTADGLHFKSEYYNKWIDYLKTHTINPEQK